MPVVSRTSTNCCSFYLKKSQLWFCRALLQMVKVLLRPKVNTTRCFLRAHGSLIEKLALTDTHAFEAGATLAKLHRQLSLYPRNGLPNEMFPVIQLSWNRELWLQRLDKIIAAIESKGEQNVEDEWALQRSIQQRSFLASSQSVHSYETKTERILIHGDFHHYNLFFDKRSKVSGIIDWGLGSIHASCLRNSPGLHVHV